MVSLDPSKVAAVDMTTAMGAASETDTIADIVNAYELPIECGHCGAQTSKPIGWLRAHRDMTCPSCSAVIVLNTSRITGAIRSVERRLSDLQLQLLDRIRKL